MFRTVENVIIADIERFTGAVKLLQEADYLNVGVLLFGDLLFWELAWIAFNVSWIDPVFWEKGTFENEY